MSMSYRRLGSSGLQVSSLSFGSWVTFANQVDTAAAERLMGYAFDQGVTFFDNAEAYAGGRSEEVMGEAITNLGWRRDAYVVSSKVFWGKDHKNPRPTQEGLSRKHVVEACHAALRRLRVDYLDLYFCHRPDPNTPVLETVRAMNDLVTQGKVLYWGTSEWPADRIIEAHEAARSWNLVPPTMEQPEYNLLNRRRVEQEYAPLYSRFGLGTTIFSPLAAGLLSGRYENGIPADGRAAQPGYEWLANRLKGEHSIVPRLKSFGAIARRLGTTPARLGVAWCLRNPQVSTVILGASRIEQLQENIKALDDVALLTPEVLAELG